MALHAVESGNVPCPSHLVWELVCNGEFEFRVDAFKVERKQPPAVGETFDLMLCAPKIMPPAKRSFRILDINDALMNFKFELIPAAGAPTEVHNINVRHVTSDNTTFVAFETDFGKDTPKATVDEWRNQTKIALSVLSRLTSAPRRTAHPFRDKAKHMDSTNWDHVPLRDSDVLVLTHAKSGTTWTQQIMWQLVNGGKANPADYDQVWHSPWVDMNAVPPPPVKAKWINSLPDRRVLKSHLPLDALPWNTKTRYIYIGRDGRDVIMSLFNHHNSLTDALRGMLNVGPVLEFAPFFDAFLTGSIYWDWFSHIVSYWKYRHLSNLLLVHYNDLKADSRSEIRRIAKFCNIVLDEKQLDNVVEHSSFEWMRNTSTCSRLRRFCSPRVISSTRARTSAGRRS